MKQFFHIFMPAAFIFLCGCTSVPANKTDAERSEHTPQQPEKQQTFSGAASDAENRNTGAQEDLRQTESVSAAAQLYEQLVSRLGITVISETNVPVCGKAFSKPFKARIDGNESLSAAVIVEYPAAKENGIISFAQTELMPDSSGIISFLPPVPQFACDSFIAAYIKPQTDADADDMQLQKIIEEHACRSKYRVRTALAASGGSIAIVDYDKTGKPITNNSKSSSALLAALMQSGFSNIGNSDFTALIVEGNTEELANAAKRLFGNSVTYFIYGTVSYACPPKTNENNTKTVSLEGNITCVNLKTGIEYFTLKKICEASAKTEQEAFSLAQQDLLARETAPKIIYGM
ncbi:MAG: hypothetical protein NC041_06060 [Bacteroides sp.]|nr:hypothetical protein [Prevotella sp.]MCM1407520.1 hypothetical protein [Treponema brennaborense]MCM1470010.1 hypothetical protein [Bacteroides sp.]